MSISDFKVSWVSSAPLWIMMLLFLYGCSDNKELTRTLAKQIILENSDYPKEVTNKVFLEWTMNAVLRNGDTFLKSMEENGFGTGTYKVVNVIQNGNVTRNRKSEYSLELTEKAKPYIRGDVKISRGLGGHTKEVKVLTFRGEFAEVTGISFMNEEKTVAAVEYSESYEPTPFANVQFPGAMAAHAAKVDRKARFRLYDDGWRIQ